MKNPRVSLLIIVTLAVLAFTIGIFLCKNYSGKEITLSFPEEMAQIPAITPEKISAAHSSIGSVIDINSASYEELTKLPGIGEGLALEIISYRAANGGFSHVEELVNVPGIGEARLEAILDLIKIGGNP